MALKERILEDIKVTMKARNQELLTILRGLHAVIKQVEVDTRKDVSDEEVISLIQKEVKKRRDALEFAKQAQRAELIAQNENEIKVLQGYLGEQLDEAKLREMIQTLISSGNDNIGKIMGALNKDHKGKFEGKIASEIAKQLLGA